MSAAWQRSLVLIFATLASGAAHAQSVDRMGLIGPYLGQCVDKRLTDDLSLPDSSIRRQVTFSLSFRSDGSIFGQPRRTYSFPSAEVPDQRRFIEAIAREIRACAPLPFSKELGGAIAGRQFLFRYISRANKDLKA